MVSEPSQPPSTYSFPQHLSSERFQSEMLALTWEGSLESSPHSTIDQLGILGALLHLSVH